MFLRRTLPGLSGLLLAVLVLTQCDRGTGTPARDDDKPRLVAQLGHSGAAVYAVALSPDGSRLLTAGADGTARLWDVSTGAELRSVEASGQGHSKQLHAASFSPDGHRFITGSVDGTARLWETETGAELRRVDHRSDVSSTAFSPDGSQFLTGSWDGTARLWDARTGSELRRFQTPSTDLLGWVTAVAFSPDGRSVLTGSSDGTARLWDIETGDETLLFDGHSGRVTSTTFSPDGRQVLTASNDSTARLWDAASGVELRRVQPGAEVYSVAFSPDGRRFVTGSSDGRARLFSTRSDTELRQLEGHSGIISSVVFASDSRRLLTSGWDGTARLWDAETGAELRRFEGLGSSVHAVAFSPDGRRALVGGDGGTAHLWDLETGQWLRRLEASRGRAYAVAFAPNGQQIVTGSDDRIARLWDTETGAEIRRFEDHALWVSSVAFSPDGDRVLTGGGGPARLWDARTGAELRQFAQSGGIHVVAFSPDGARILTGSAFSDTVKAWDVNRGITVQRYTGHRSLTSVAFSPDGERVLTGGTDGRASLWETSTGLALQHYRGHRSVTSLAFSPDGRQILTGGQDGAAQLWDTNSGARRRRFEGSSRSVNSVAFSPDGRRILTGSSDGTARVWDAETGSELARLISFRDGTWAVVDPEGRYDASDGGDVAGLHWVVGLEPIALSQLKERYYEPGLLAKILGFNEEPLRSVDAFDAVALHPQVKTEWDGTTLRARLLNRGGGIGRVGVWLNGKEVTADAREPGADPNADTLTLTLDLTGHPYLIAGAENEVEVRAFNAEEYLSSRGTKSRSRARGEQGPPPELWAVVAGVSDYAGDELDLRYAEKDAVDMAAALELGAQNLFGAERVHVRLLTTADGVPAAEAPTKANLVTALEEIGEQASATDILVVYLAGHGVTHGGPEGDFFYLTQEASSGSLEDPAVRESRAVSTAELTDLIADVAALKQVLILDTCGSGRVVEQMTESRDVSSSQKRALERLKDRMGTYVLAGSAADAVSYEASRYGQGLLTYSLLLGMRGAALREEQFVDVGRWFDHAVDQVPELARGIGGIQQPQLATPRGSQSFDVAQLEPEDRERILLADPKPFVVRATFQDQDRVVDHLGLTRRVNDALRAVSTRGPDAPLVFVDAPDLPGAYTLGGLYRVEGAEVAVTAVLSTGSSEPIRFTLQGDTSDLDRLVTTIIEEVEDRVES